MCDEDGGEVELVVEVVNVGVECVVGYGIECVECFVE